MATALEKLYEYSILQHGHGDGRRTDGTALIRAVCRGKVDDSILEE